MTTPRDAGNWAANVDRLAVGAEVAESGYNIAGRRLTGPQQGFGKLWQRTYTTTVGSAVTPQQLVSDWKQHFGEFWPDNATFHASLTGVSPGAVSPIAIDTGAGLSLATGVLVLYADDESFTFMTPEGHMFAGWITFSGVELPDGATQAHIQILIRTNDPLYELGWPVMRRREDVFWSTTLRNLAARYGVADAVVEEVTACVDRKRLWHNWTNVRHNAGMRSVTHALGSPLRSMRPARSAG